MASFEWPSQGGGASSGVTSLNSLTGDITLIAGTGITITPSGSDLTIASTSSSSDSFVFMEPITGTPPTAMTPMDTLTFLSSDGYITVNGNTGTNSLDFGVSSSLLALISANVSSVTASTPLFSSGGTTPNLTIQQANTSQSGFLSASDWNTFNSKQPAGSYVTSVTATSPLSSSGGTTPSISTTTGSLTEATSSVLTITGSNTLFANTTIQVTQSGATTSGYLSTTDWNTFNNKQSSLTFAQSLVNTSGTVTLLNDSTSPGTSEYYGTNGAGTKGWYTLPGTSGANTALSNLASVAINTSLLPGTSNSINLGSSTDTWANEYIGTQLFAPLITGLGSTGASITLRGGLAASSGAGGAVTVAGAQGDSGNGAGGQLNLLGGAAGGAGGTNESGGAVVITAGASVGSATGGTVTISSSTGGTGTSTAGATGGTTNINGGTGGAGSSTSGNGGGATLKGGSGGGGVAGGTGGTAQLTGGTGGTGSASGGNGGDADVSGGNAGSFAGTNGGAVNLASGNGSGTGAGGNGGNITIATGTAGGNNTTNTTGGNLTLSVGHSMGGGSGGQVSITAGTGGVGTSTTGAGGGALNLNAGSGGAGSSTGGGGGNIVLEAGQGGSSTTSGTGGFIQFQTASTTSLTEKMRILAAGGVNIVNGALNVTTAGNGVAIAHGSNCKLGTATLSAGTVTVSNTTVTSNSVFFLTVQTLGTVSVPSAVAVTSKNVGTSFTITSGAVTDTSTVAWMIVEQL